MKTKKVNVKEVVDNNAYCPIPLDVFPNQMGINLVSVDSVEWVEQEDGQLDKVTINFIANNTQQETLEEAAENYANKKGHIPTTELEDAIFKQGFLDGAKRMYSEGNKIMKFLDTEYELGISDKKTIERIKWYFKTYFEQFKKK
jgi:hypothetical protein